MIITVIKHLLWAFVFSIICITTFDLPAIAQTFGEDIQTEQEQYHESALRRFEIIFTISIPFTGLHSYLAVRGVEMIRQSKVSPKFSRGDWTTVGSLTILFSGFVAFWDYMHTRNKDIHGVNIPRRQDEPLGMMPREPMLKLVSVGF